MKNIVLIIAAVLGLSGVAISAEPPVKPLNPDVLLGRYLPQEREIAANTYLDHGETKTTTMLKRIDTIFDSRDKGEISREEAAGRAYAAAFHYFPNDPLFLDLNRDRIILLSTELTGEISKEDAANIWVSRTAKFQADIDARSRGVQADIAARESAQRNATMSQMLNSAARGVNRAVQQQPSPRNCTFNAAGGVVTCF